jgi:hypothetical protein
MSISSHGGATGRTVIMLMAASAIGLAVRAQVLAPMFHDDVGFIPLDLQHRLNPEMIVIQLGASPARLGLAYQRFALMDSVVTVITAAFVVTLWLWLFRNAPNRIFSFVQNGGILFVPLVAAAAELAEHVAICRLLDMQHDGYGSAIDLVVTLHATKSAFGIVRDLLTSGFVLVALVWLVRNRRRAPR